MAKRSGTDYFDSLTVQFEYSLKASRLLDAFIRKYDVSDIFRVTEEMKLIMSESSKNEKTLLFSLKKEFLPPIDSEDIFALTKGISGTVQAISDALECIYICNPYTVTNGTQRLSDLLLVCYEKLYAVIANLKAFKKSDSLTALLDSCAQSKDCFEKAYQKAQKELFGETQDVRRLLCFNEMHGNLRKCCDACSSVAELVELTAMKNT